MLRTFQNPEKGLAFSQKKKKKKKGERRERKRDLRKSLGPKINPST
jgi:hypothetical protein